MSSKISNAVYALFTRRMVTLYICIAAMVYKPEVAQYISLLGAAVIGVALSDSIVTKNSNKDDQQSKE